MKKTLIALTCGLALALSASTAQALAIDDANHLGSLANATPSNSDAQITYINFLIGMAAPSTDTTNLPGNNTIFTRSDNACATLGGCPLATAGISDLAPDGRLTSPAGVAVCEVRWRRARVVCREPVRHPGCPTDVGGEFGGQSHYALYNATTTQVPDGGATLGLLGLGMLGLGYLRRRKQQ